MKGYKVFAILVIIIVSFSKSGLSQEGYYQKDFETWSSIGLKYNPAKWTFELEEQIRLKENSSMIDQYFTEVLVGYELFKKLELRAGTRFIRNNDTQGKIQGYENQLRLQFDLIYREKIDRLTIGGRVRYQNKNELGISGLAGDYPDQNIRVKPFVKYNFKNWKFDPELSGEIFRHFQAGEKSQFNKYRISFGTDFKIWNLGELGVFYLFEREIYTYAPRMANIVRIKYIYNF